jgi:hypothetical protein
MARKIVENWIVNVTRGSVVQIDGGRCEPLFACTDWDQAEFRWPNPIHEWREKHAIACNIEITGRTFQYRRSNWCVRVRIIWVGDGEPNTSCTGWLLISPWDCERVDN